MTLKNQRNESSQVAWRKAIKKKKMYPNRSAFNHVALDLNLSEWWWEQMRKLRPREVK